LSISFAIIWLLLDEVDDELSSLNEFLSLSVIRPALEFLLVIIWPLQKRVVSGSRQTSEAVTASPIEYDSLLLLCFEPVHDMYDRHSRVDVTD
jgi:hypothetical protein